MENKIKDKIIFFGLTSKVYNYKEGPAIFLNGQKVVIPEEKNSYVEKIKQYFCCSGDVEEIILNFEDPSDNYELEDKIMELDQDFFDSIQEIKIKSDFQEGNKSRWESAKNMDKKIIEKMMPIIEKIENFDN